MPNSIVITGGKGMLGRTLARKLAPAPVVSLGSSELDVSDPKACEQAIGSLRPRVVIHCAAMTAVDRCESEPDLAFRVNAQGCANIASACSRHQARLVAISTDYVFDGKLERPYHEWDLTGPLTVYGSSKYAGEEAIRARCPDHLIARVAWLYGPGGPSFLHTMLKLGSQAEASPLKIVTDQIGNPTSTDAVADNLIPLLHEQVVGTMHLTCEGMTSWFGFAEAIFSACPLPRSIRGCTTTEFPRPAPRPANSCLDKLALRLQGRPALPDWKEALERFLYEFPKG